MFSQCKHHRTLPSMLSVKGLHKASCVASTSSLHCVSAGHCSAGLHCSISKTLSSASPMHPYQLAVCLHVHHAHLCSHVQQYTKSTCLCLYSYTHVWCGESNTAHATCKIHVEDSKMGHARCTQDTTHERVCEESSKLRVPVDMLQA